MEICSAVREWEANSIRGLALSFVLSYPASSVQYPRGPVPTFISFQGGELAAVLVDLVGCQAAIVAPPAPATTRTGLPGRD